MQSMLDRIARHTIKNGIRIKQGLPPRPDFKVQRSLHKISLEQNLIEYDQVKSDMLWKMDQLGLGPSGRKPPTSKSKPIIVPIARTPQHKKDPLSFDFSTPNPASNQPWDYNQAGNFPSSQPEHSFSTPADQQQRILDNLNSLVNKLENIT